MEAAANLPGRNTESYEALQPKLDELHVLELMNTKRAGFVKKMQACELELFKMQLDARHPHFEGQAALWYFKSWLTNKLNEGQGSGLLASYAVLYRSIWCYINGAAPMVHQNLLTVFTNGIFGPLPQDSIAAIFQSFRIIMQQAAQIVQPLIQSKTKRRANPGDFNRDLTCVGIDDDEVPWPKT